MADDVFDQLLTMLLDGTLKAGSSLNIDGLARELDVSPTPVREALARLESTGMVTRVALRGYSVSPAPSSKELADLMEARLVIEPESAAFACARGTGQFLVDLEQAVTDLENASNGPTYQEFRDYWAADERFHELIAEATDNHFLLASWHALGGLIQRFRQFAGVGVTDKDEATAEHREILDALRTGDPDLARDAMRRHIEGVRSRSMEERRGGLASRD